MTIHFNYSNFFFNSLGLLMILVLFGCKKPRADFQLTQYEYAAGDQIQYMNHAVNDRSNTWEIINPDGTVSRTFEENHPTILIDLLAPNGKHILKLTSYDRRKKKSSSIEKEFFVKSVKKTLSINGTNPYIGDQKNFNVYVDGQFLGSSTYYSFMNHGYYNTTIPKGIRWVKVVSDYETLEGMYDFNNNVYIAF